MHTIEPYWNWRNLYAAELDEQSPFYGREYSETFYEVGGCLVGVSPEAEGNWEPFKAQFCSPTQKATLYLVQEGTAYNSWFKDLRIQLIQDGPSTHSLACSLTHSLTRSLAHSRARAREGTRACTHALTHDIHRSFRTCMHVSR